VPPTDYSEEAHLIPEEESWQHALLGIVRNAAAGLPGVAAWLSATVRNEPLVIHDINGRRLFYDYQVEMGGETVGYVRVAASKVLGPPVVAIELGPRHWNFRAAVRKLIPLVKEEFPEDQIGPAILVCYGYPKLGVLFEIRGEESRTRAILDVADLTRISEQPSRPPVEGAYAWSFYESLADADRRSRLKRYVQADAARLDISSRQWKALRGARSVSAAARKIDTAWRKVHTKLLQFCTHFADHRPRAHHCLALHGEEQTLYCAVAVCQMILCYYRYYYTQDQIAPALDFSVAQLGCPADQSPGYKTLSCNHLDAGFDNPPTWEKARDQIDQLHPLKSGVPGHARAVAGHSYTLWKKDASRKLYLYDPSPTNPDLALGGTLVWEDWDSVRHTNYVYTRIRCPE
jgi:hypothetical protein